MTVAASRISNPYEWMSSFVPAVPLIGLIAFLLMQDTGQAALGWVILKTSIVGVPACWAGVSLAGFYRLRSAGHKKEAETEAANAVVYGLMIIVGGLLFLLESLI